MSIMTVILKKNVTTVMSECCNEFIGLTNAYWFLEKQKRFQ